MKERIVAGNAAAVLLCLLFLLSSGESYASGNSESGLFSGISGSGTVGTEVRELSGFTGVTIAGSGQSHITPGSSFRVEVTADQNLLRYVTTEVRNGVLVLGMKPGITVRRITRLEYRISMPTLAAATIKGSGSISLDSRAEGDRLALSIEGSGSITADVDVKTLVATISGSGDITVNGKATGQQIKVAGSGSVDNRGVSSKTVDVNIGGSGDVWVTCEEKLDANIAGSGNLYYRGGAQPSIRSAGSGRVLTF
ncbi:head GIN domain-containing protein [Salinispira pacifica]